jgi:phosphate acyltransferase
MTSDAASSAAAGNKDRGPDLIRVSVDCMGGDHAPEEVVLGALDAARALGLRVLLVGVPEALAPFLPRGDGQDPHWELVPSDEAVPEGAPPLATLRAMPRASMAVTMRLVHEGRAQAGLSAGNTGAVLLAAVREIGMLEGARRACIGRSIFGLTPQTFLIDLGPTMDCEAHHLVEFAVDGTTYMRVFGGIPEPTVALLSNGRERGKGNRVVKQAADLMSRSGLRFIGLVEGHDLMEGKANVVVCDGFVGNAVLKSVEGLGRQLAQWLRRELARSLPDARAGDLPTRLVELTNQIDLHGCLPLLGVRGNVILAHGASDRRAIAAGVGQAAQAVRARFVDKLRTALADTRSRLAQPVAAPPSPA